MVIMCNDIVTIELDERILGLPNAPAVMEHDNNRTEESTAIALNITHNLYIFTYPLSPILSQPSHSKNILHLSLDDSRVWYQLIRKHIQAIA